MKTEVVYPNGEVVLARKYARDSPKPPLTEEQLGLPTDDDDLGRRVREQAPQQQRGIEKYATVRSRRTGGQPRRSFYCACTGKLEPVLSLQGPPILHTAGDQWREVLIWHAHQIDLRKPRRHELPQPVEVLEQVARKVRTVRLGMFGEVGELAHTRHGSASAAARPGRGWGLGTGLVEGDGW